MPAGVSDSSTPKNFSFGVTRLAMTRDDSSNPSIMLFAQLDEDAIARRRMQKRDAASVRARHRRLVDQSIALLFQAIEVRLQVRHPKADVMDAFPALVDEFRDRRVGPERLKQLQMGLANIQKGGL